MVIICVIAFIVGYAWRRGKRDGGKGSLEPAGGGGGGGGGRLRLVA